MEKINNIPEGWVETNLGSFMKTGTGSVDPSRYKEEVFELYSIPAYDSDKPEIVKGERIGSSKKVIVENDVLLSRIVPHIQRSWIVGPSRGYRQIGSGEWIIFDGSKINTKYLRYFLLSYKFHMEFMTTVSGVGGSLTRANPNLTAKFSFPLPPLSEQNRIVEKLDELFSELEKGKEQLQLALAQLKVYRQAVLKWAFEGRLTQEWRRKQKKLKTPDELVAEIKEYRKQQYEEQIKEYKAGIIKVKPKEPKDIIPLTPIEIKSLPELPNGWTYVKVSSLGDVATGTTPSKAKPEYYGDKYPFYKPTDLDAGFNVKKAKEYLSESGIKQARFLPVNSILVTSIGATIGKTGIIRIAGASNQQINAIIPHEIFNPNFLYFQAIGQHFQEQIQSNAVATTLPILNKSKFEKLIFAICSLEEQNFIVDDIESKFLNAEKIEATIFQSLKISDTLNQSLLQQAFEGKLVPQDPHDEPATVLLARIQREREEFLTMEKGRKKTKKPLKTKSTNMNGDQKTIIEILQASKEPVPAKTLWQSSEHKDYIDAFYDALKKHIEAGEIIELPRKGKESFLKLADAK